MNASQTAPAGAPCWIELMTSDREASVRFYEDLLGWVAQPSSEEFGGYFMFTRDGVPVAGGMPSGPGLDMGDQWGIYLSAEDARKTAAAAETAGGEIRAATMEVADLGTSAVVNDPGGARVGIWQAASFPGLTVRGEPGTPVWFELLTRSYEPSVAFYRQVFGWDAHTMSETPQLRYTTLGEEESALAGIMDASQYLAEGASSHWTVYFAVEDADAAATAIDRLGGSVLEEPTDTPHGRIAAAADPNGAQFRIVSS